VSLQPLSDLRVPTTAIPSRQHLRFAATYLLTYLLTGTQMVPRARTATGQRSFTVN